MTAALTRDQQNALSIARQLAAAGIPIFVAYPDSSAPTGYRLPSGWQRVIADTAVVVSWRPGMALCAVMGHGLDLVDIDPRNGGDPATLDGEMPISYGCATTPSEGVHSFIKSLGVRSCDNIVAGIDIKAGNSTGEGRGFAFIAPTERVSKVDGVKRPYEWIRPPDLDRLNAEGPQDDSGKALVRLINAKRNGHRPVSSGVPTPAEFMQCRPWDDIERTLAEGRNNGVHKLASALRGKGGHTLEDAMRIMDDRVWSLIETAPGDHPFTRAEFEAAICSAWQRYPDGAERRAIENVKDAGTQPGSNNDIWEASEMGPTARRSRAGRPELHVGSPAIAAEWLRENIGSGQLAGMFNRDDAIVYTPQEGEEGYIRLTKNEDDSDGPVQIQPVTADRLVAIIQYTFSCYRKNERIEKDGDGRDITTTVRTATIFPRSAAKIPVEVPHMLPNLRVLRGVIHSPLVRSDGSILSQPGYDDATRLLHIPAPGLIVPEVSDNPTRAEIAAAVALLEEMVADFRFLTDDHKANYFGLLLTPLLREMVPPPYKMGAISAPQPGSGKSLLASIMRIIHGGVFRSEIPQDEAEIRKQITTILDTTTAPVCQFDNVTGVLRSSTLAGLLTSNRWEDRRLGTHTQISRSNDRQWVITGNNLCIGGDLVRRTMSVTIDPGVPDPHLRTGFAIPNLEGWAQERRGKLIAALLTLIRAWVAANRPTRAHGSDGFARWIETVDGILTTAGMAGSFDSAQTISRSIGSDDEEWAEFLASIYMVFGTQEWTVKHLLIGAPPEPAQPARPPIPLDALPSPLAEKVSRSNTGPTIASKSLGRWLANHEGRWAGQLTVRSAGRDRTNSTRWRIETPTRT
jgi:hypothetical protein